MMNISRILVANNGARVLVVMADINGNVINHVDREMNARLTNDDYQVDRATIAELCGMTEEEFTINYGTRECEYNRENGIVTLAYAEFDERDEETKEIIRNNGGRSL